MKLDPLAATLLDEARTIRPFPLLVLLVGIGIAYQVIHALYVIYWHPLAKIPAYGKWQHLTVWWSVYTALVTQDRVFRLDKAQRKLGKVLRFSPDEVVINDLAILQSIMHARLDKVRPLPLMNATDTTQLPGGAAFTTNRGTPNSFSAIGNAEAAGKRKTMMAQYATKTLDDWQPIFSEHV
jgi:hypothetical protein